MELLSILIFVFSFTSYLLGYLVRGRWERKLRRRGGYMVIRPPKGRS